jgi:hypothetical protein
VPEVGEHSIDQYSGLRGVDGGQYDETEMARLDILSKEFAEGVADVTRNARNESLALGLSVFYREAETDRDMMELPDGRRFQIRLIPGASRGTNYEIIREISADAA